MSVTGENQSMMRHNGKHKMRRCLRCSRMFMSPNAGVRFCGTCRKRVTVETGRAAGPDGTGYKPLYGFLR